jgi:hypothetical protein
MAIADFRIDFVVDMTPPERPLQVANMAWVVVFGGRFGTRASRRRMADGVSLERQPAGVQGKVPEAG